MNDREIVSELVELQKLDKEIADIVWESDFMKDIIIDKLLALPEVKTLVESYKIDRGV